MKNKPPQDWTNRKNVTLPAEMHAAIKTISDRDGLTIYEVIEQSIAAYEWRRQLLEVAMPHRP